MSYQLQVVWFHWDYGVQPDSLSRFTRDDEEFAAVHSVSLFFFFFSEVILMIVAYGYTTKLRWKEKKSFLKKYKNTSHLPPFPLK